MTDLTTRETTVVRRLNGGGNALGNPVVWSEVFAPCDAPSVLVRWSDFSPQPLGLRPTYQTHDDGGCSNTTSRREGVAFLQITNTDRERLSG